jgi:hypothetical protein
VLRRGRLDHRVTSELAFILSTNDGTQLVAAAGIGAMVGVYLFYRGFRMLQRKRLILDTPASKIRSAAMGLVELSGLADGPYTTTSPITGMPCYYYRTIAWQWQQRGKNSEWVKVADESFHVPFYLDDNTGRVLVDPQGAELDIHRDFHDEFSNSIFSSHLDVPLNISTFLVRHGVSGSQKIKVDEYCIKPKNSLFILGTLAENPGLSLSATPVRSLTADQHAISFHIPDPVGSLSLGSISGTMTFASFTRDQSPRGFDPMSGENKLAHSMTVSQPVAQPEKVIAALTKAGITNPAAWAAAGVSTAVAAKLAPDAAGAGVAPAADKFDPHPPVVLMKGKHDPAFFISWRSQRDVVRSLSWKSTLMIWGGPALTLLCVYILAWHFDWL